MDIVFSAEVRVKGPLHCWDCVWNPGFGYRLFRGGEGRKTVALRDYVWNPGYGYRFSRGGEDQEIVALLGLRLESRVRTSFIPRR